MATLVSFLAEVDGWLKNTTKEDADAAIHELARGCKEGDRTAFLAVLQSIHDGSPSTDVLADRSVNHHSVSQELEELKESYACVNDGLFCLDSQYNEEWDDWYENEEEEVLFSDPHGILSDIGAGITLLHRCSDLEMYEEAYEIGQELANLRVQVEGDYLDLDYGVLSLRELVEQELISGDFSRIVMEALYAAYRTHSTEESPLEILKLIESFEYPGFRIDDFAQFAPEELENYPEFIRNWFLLLASKPGEKKDHLLRDALHSIEDDELVLSAARENGGLHPSLFMYLLEEGKFDLPTRIEIGNEAMRNIPEATKTRSNVACLAAECARQAGDEKKKDEFLLEAFRSDTSLENFLRLRIFASDFTAIRDTARRIYESVYQKTIEAKETKTYSDLLYSDGNMLHNQEYDQLRFFDDREEEVFKKLTGDPHITPLDPLILGFFLLLFRGDDYQKGTKDMEALFFEGITFRLKWFDKDKPLPISDILGEWLGEWKKESEISEDQKKEWYQKLAQIVDGYVSDTMKFNHRKEYGRCAMCIAALGEIRESWGETGSKTWMMEKYRSEYSRRSAFMRELNAYTNSGKRGKK